MKQMLSNIATGVLLSCAVVLTATVAHRELSKPQTTRTGEIVTEVKNWQRLTKVGHVLGDTTSRVQIVEFSDYQCPFCREADAAVSKLLSRNHGKISLVFRHFPLKGIHPNAFAAALASECAHEQNRFQEFHSALFANSDSVSKGSWNSLAAMAGVGNLTKFNKCVSEQEFASRVQADMDEGTALGISGTPTFIFQGKMVAGLPGLELAETWLRSQK